MIITKAKRANTISATESKRGANWRSEKDALVTSVVRFICSWYGDSEALILCSNAPNEAMPKFRRKAIMNTVIEIPIMTAMYFCELMPFCFPVFTYSFVAYKLFGYFLVLVCFRFHCVERVDAHLNNEAG